MRPNHTDNQNRVEMGKKNTRDVKYLQQDGKVYRKNAGVFVGYILEYAKRPGMFVTRQNSVFKPGYLGAQRQLPTQERVVFFLDRPARVAPSLRCVEAIIDDGVIKRR